MMEQNPHRGELFEDFLTQEGIRDEVYAEAVKFKIARDLEAARVAKHVKKVDLAKAMGTSRSQLDRLFDPASHSLSIDALDRAARALGMRLDIRLVEDSTEAANR